MQTSNDHVEQTDADGQSTGDPSGNESSISKKPGFLLRFRSWDLYTVLLAVAMISLVVACVMMYLELARYGSFPQWRTT